MKYLTRIVTACIGLIILIPFILFILRSTSSKTVNAAPNNTVKFDTTQIKKISSPANTIGEFGPQVAIDTDGVSHVVYTTQTTYQLMYTNNRGGTFTDPVVLDSIVTIGTDSRPALVFANGTLHLLYTVNQHEIYYRQGNASTGQWNPRLLVKSATYRSYGGGLAVDAGGTAHITWIDERCAASGFNVFYRTYAGGTFGPEMSPMGNNCVLKNMPRVVIAGGKPHVIFRWTNDIYYTRFDGASWSAVQNISSNPATASHNPSITTNGSTVYIAWAEATPTNNHDVYMKYSTDGGLTWSAQLTVAGQPGFEEFPSMTWVSSVNSGYITWSDGNVPGNETEIFLHEFEPAPGPFNSPVRLTCMVNGSDIPHINANASKAAIVWQDRIVNNLLQIYYIDGIVGSGQTTTSCALAPTIIPPTGGAPTGGAPTQTPTPSATKVPTRTPTPSPTSFQIPTPDAQAIKRLAIRSGNEPAPCFNLEWIVFYAVASGLYIMFTFLAIHINNEFNLYQTIGYFVFGGAVSWFLQSCDLQFIGLIIGAVLSFLFW